MVLAGIVVGEILAEVTLGTRSRDALHDHRAAIVDEVAQLVLEPLAALAGEVDCLVGSHAGSLAPRRPATRVGPGLSL
jgi:hypothetical protein